MSPAANAARRWRDSVKSFLPKAVRLSAADFLSRKCREHRWQRNKNLIRSLSADEEFDVVGPEKYRSGFEAIAHACFGQQVVGPRWVILEFAPQLRQVDAQVVSFLGVLGPPHFSE